MKVSYKLLKEYIDLEGLSVKDITDKLTLAGFELEGYVSLSSGDHLVIGEVIECVNHPNSDHLHVTKTCIGNETLQIVCGAPNCRKGLKVIVALPGANLPAKGVRIEKGVIRDVESNGMLCSLVELGVPESMLSEAQKEGIEELPLDAVVGNDNPLGYLGLDDTIIDFSITPNRADCFGLIHFFKEVSAILDRKMIKDLDADVKRVGNCSFEVTSETKNCDYFTISEIKDIVIKPSPKWMQEILGKHDIKCINNVVDIGNYVTLLTGQPLHMYDADKLGCKKFIVKDNVNKVVKALDDKDYQINEGDLVVTNNGDVVCIAGVIGDASSMIDENTKNIALEAALFDGTTIGNSAKRYGIMTTAATNYSKNAVDRYKTLKASDIASSLLIKYADAKSVSNAAIYNALNIVEKHIKITLDFINNKLATNYSLEDVSNVFRRLDFKYDLNNTEFDILVPTYRNDIEIKEDIVEEVVRLIGFDTIDYNIPSVISDSYGLTEVQKGRKIISNYLLDNGLTNTLSYSLIKKEDANYYGVFNKDTYIVLPHPLTVEKEYLRKNLMASLLQTIFYNQARGIKDVAIFEMSNIYTNEKLMGHEKLAIAISNGLNNTKWLGNKKIDFYLIKGLVCGILNIFGIEPNRYSFEMISNVYKDQVIFHPGKSALLKVNGKYIGVLGEIHPNTLKKEGIDPTLYFEMDLTEFFNIKTSKCKYNAVSKYPTVTRDLAIIVKDDLPASKIISTLKKSAGPVLTSIDVFDVYKGEHVKDGYKSIALTMNFNDPNKTLTENEINEAFNKVYNAAVKEFNAVIRG